jgi:hypothetical protein
MWPGEKKEKEKREIGENGRETSKLKQFVCKVSNSKTLVNWMSIAVRHVDCVPYSEISLVNPIDITKVGPPGISLPVSRCR